MTSKLASFLLSGLVTSLPLTVHAAEPTPPPVTPPPTAPAPAPVDPGAAPPPEGPGAPGSEVAATVAPTDQAPADDGVKLVIGLKLGGALNGVFNSLDAAFTPELEFGVMLPPLEHAFEIFLSGRYAAPTGEGTTPADPRLPGDGVASWDVTRNEVALGLGLRFRPPMDGDFTPYLGAGARLYLLSTEVKGQADGQAFGTNEESGSAWGFMFQLGGELTLGPGAALLELAINGAGLDQTVLADTNVSSFDIYLGYRFIF